MLRNRGLDNVPDFAKSKYAPAVVGNMSYSGLGLARGLGRYGIPVIGFSPTPDMVGMESRFVTPVISPDVDDQEEEFLEFLRALSRKLGRKAVFFPTGDNTVLLLAKYKEELKHLYEFVVPDTHLIQEIVGKDTVIDLCSKHDIPAPRTLRPNSREEMLDAVDRIGTPCIIKPVFSPSWWRQDVAEIVNRGKVVQLNSSEDALRYYDALSHLDDRVIVQEIIPGADSNLYYFVFYVNREGEVLVRFAGQKLRVTPAHFGSASYVKSIYDPNLEEISLRFLDATGYIGLGGIEFKLDPRDNTFKLIEVNARFGLWDVLATKCGIALPHIAYRDALRMPVEKHESYQEGVIWVSLVRDLSAFKQYRQEGGLSVLEWLKSLGGKKYSASFAWNDPKPGIYEALRYIRSKTIGVVGSKA